MRKRYLRVLSLSLLLSTLAFTGCGCSKTIEISFVGNNGTVVRTIKKGQTLNQNQIPATPQVKGKYCLWDEVDFSSLKNDTTINYTCYDSLLRLESNLDSNIEVEIDSEEADLDYILRNLRLTATLEDGTKRYLYRDDIVIDTDGYNKGISGEYTLGLKYNNKEVFVNVRVKKIANYVTAILDSDRAYLCEGLPKITAITDVPGEIKFDDNQPMVSTGIYNFKWTFTPTDTNKYEVVHGVSAINVTQARSIQTNKSEDVYTFDYYTSKQDIINSLKEGLDVVGEFSDWNGNAIYREIDSKYYIIDSDYKEGYAGNIDFKVIYHANVPPAIIQVNILQNDNYDVNVITNPKYEITQNSTLQDIEIVYDSGGITGQFKFDEGQTLKLGSYIYTYTFTPNHSYYAVKKGQVTINTYKVVGFEVDSSYNPKYDYNNTLSVGDLADEIGTALKLKGRFVYNDGTTAVVGNNNVFVTIDERYDPTIPGMYKYYVSYDDVEAEFTFEVKKRKLEYKVDFTIETATHIDPNNLSVFPKCVLTSKKVDPKDFTIEPDFSRGITPINGYYVFYVNIIPNENVSDMFDVVTGIEVIGITDPLA